MLKSLFVLAMAVAAVRAESILEVDTKMADSDTYLSRPCDICDDCGLDTFFGSGFSLQVCGPTGCCVANDMTDGNNNFDEGEEDTFSGDDELGDCWLYDLGDVSLSTDIEMTLFHTGNDAGTMEYAQVVLDSGEVYRCYFCEDLDGGESTEGHDCERRA